MTHRHDREAVQAMSRLVRLRSAASRHFTLMLLIAGPRTASLLVENFSMKDEFQLAQAFRDPLETAPRSRPSANDPACSATDATVLLTGETGPQRVFSVAIQLSLAHRPPFCDCECAAIPHTLIDNECWYMRSLVHGLVRTEDRQVRTCRSGPMLLDEIGNCTLRTG